MRSRLSPKLALVASTLLAAGCAGASSPEALTTLWETDYSESDRADECDSWRRFSSTQDVRYDLGSSRYDEFEPVTDKEVADFLNDRC
jgi:hypothetical protein